MLRTVPSPQADAGSDVACRANRASTREAIGDRISDLMWSSCRKASGSDGSFRTARGLGPDEGRLTREAGVGEKLP